MFDWGFQWHQRRYQDNITKRVHFTQLLFNGCLIRHLGGTILFPPANDNT